MKLILEYDMGCGDWMPIEEGSKNKEEENSFGRDKLMNEIVSKEVKYNIHGKQ